MLSFGLVDLFRCSKSSAFWTSLFVNGIINFIIPILLYMAARRFRSQALAEADAKERRAVAATGTDGVEYSDTESGSQLRGGINDNLADVERNSQATAKTVELMDLPFAAYPEAGYPMVFASILVAVFSAAIIAAITLTFES